MCQGRGPKQKHTRKKVASRKETARDVNILNRKFDADVSRSNSFNSDKSKYDNFGRVSKNHVIKCHKKNEEKDPIIIEQKGIERENTIVSKKYEIKSTIPLSESEAIKEIFGIDKFETSKNKNHSTSSISCFNVKSKRKYRQYMNRPGGFNRPLSPIQ